MSFSGSCPCHSHTLLLPLVWCPRGIVTPLGRVLPEWLLLLPRFLSDLVARLSSCWEKWLLLGSRVSGFLATRLCFHADVLPLIHQVSLTNPHLSLMCWHEVNLLQTGFLSLWSLAPASPFSHRSYHTFLFLCQLSQASTQPPFQISFLYGNFLEY